MSVDDASLAQQGHKRKRGEGEDRGTRIRRSIVRRAEKPSTKPDELKPSSTSQNQKARIEKSRDSEAQHIQKGHTQQNGKPHNPLTLARQKLPIWPQAASIRDALLQKDVLIVAGETGSGKSTQIPQFLLSSPWCTGRIAVTQPRRVAAVSVARRVAEELGTPLGKNSPAARVGYSVRFDDNVGKGNKIKFLTEGMLLQELLRDPGLSEYSCIIVDEVHERSVNVDVILGFLRNLVTATGPGAEKRAGKPLKVVVMSATADTEVLKQFFSKGYQEPVVKNAMEKIHSKEVGGGAAQQKKRILGEDRGGKDGRTQNAIEKSPVAENDKVSTCFVKGRQFPVQTNYLSEPTYDFLNSAKEKIFELHCKEPMPGDILVFVTGQDKVTDLQRDVEFEFETQLKPKLEVPNILVLPLFAALPQDKQQLIFAPAPPNTRKIIIATNIAETSITVPGVRFVIDTGLAKMKQYHSTIGLDSLLVKHISRSSAIQRQGRAGREAAGKCWRLYTKKDFDELDNDTLPEILRCDLTSAILTMKARGIDKVWDFPLLTPMPRDAMGRALTQLLFLDALNHEDGRISDLGRQMARLPLTPTLGRVVVAAAAPDMDCLLHVIDIVACLSVENVFLEVRDEDMKDEVREARSRLFRRQGDHLTLLAAVQSYVAEKADRKYWAKQHMINHRAMQSVMDVRKQLREQCRQAKLISSETLANADDQGAISETTASSILQCFLRGFRLNVARLMPDGSYQTTEGKMTIAIHPTSVLFGKKLEAIMYNEFMYTTRAWARGVSAIQLNWFEEICT